MNKLKLFGSKVLLATSLLVASTALATATPILSFSSVENASVAFTGADNSFTFVPGAGGNDFVVTLDDPAWPGGAGSLIGYLGDINGTWTIANTNTGPGQQTTVSGTGSLTLYNATKSAWVTGDLQWLTIGAIGGIGGFNVNGALNFYNLVLGGTPDANLAYLKNAGGANAVVSFQGLTSGPPPVPDGNNPEDCSGLLGQVRCNDYSTASYSGTLEVAEAPVPEPSTILLSGVALLALGLMRKRGAKRS